MSLSKTQTLAETSPGASSFAATAYDIERPSLTPNPDDAQDPLVGRRIDHFEVRGLLGEGGMGRVYLAHDLSLERPVALKVMRRELATHAELMDRMVLEARAQARLQHPNVVTIYYVGTHEGAPYFAMEYVRGETLADVLARSGPLPWAEALEYVIQTARALAAAQHRGIVHRDIKPSNLLLSARRSPHLPPGEVKVADFGLAAPLGAASEEHFVGSPFYAAPEQINGEAPTHRSDMYALGVTFYELVTGNVPFQAETLPEVLGMHQNAPRPLIPAELAPWRLRFLVAEMMDADPHKRPWTHEELIVKLEALRPEPFLSGGVVPRAMALAVDLTVMAIVGQVLAGVFQLTQTLANQVGLVAFGIYYVIAHRYFGMTLGKRLMRLRIQGTTRAISGPRLVLRFLVEFWGPITAAVMLNMQLGAATDLVSFKKYLVEVVGLREMPILDFASEAVLKTVLIPNLVLALLWLGGFAFALFDENRQALHDRAARTRVIYEMHDRGDDAQ